MTSQVTLLMAQINPTLGNIEANSHMIQTIIADHQESHDIILFPELCLTGYPPEDLLFRNELHQRIEEQLNLIASITQDCHVIVGHPRLEEERCFNSATVFYQGEGITTYDKQCLPNYSVFDEKRYFTAGEKTGLLTVKSMNFALCICEDIWQQEPALQAKLEGADCILCLNASPFYLDKLSLRQEIIAKRAKEHRLPIVYVNTVGGQDELVFDGLSFAVDKSGAIKSQSSAFTTSLDSITITQESLTGESAQISTTESLIYQALVCGTRDYVTKNGFKGALIGLSGGIDSALTLAIAVDALGSDNVQAVMMPSRFTANMSNEDALLEAQALNIKHSTLPIEPIFKQFLAGLSNEFASLKTDTTEENIQARVRGTLLMALSNKTGKIVLTTGNKSEMAVGYATLYGDMAGGFAVLKDVPKTLVYQLARYRNSISAVIPERVITRAPSAELAEDQVDQDSLPDYAILDQILHYYVECNMGVEEICEKGLAASDVKKIIRLIDINEYKRRQAPPGVRVSQRAFGRDWRYPITSGFHHALY